MLGLVIAMEEELKILLEKLNKGDFKINKGVFDHYTFKINNKKIVAVVSGVGKIKASAATQFLISNFDISRIFNFGMAGGIDTKVEIGDIVNIHTSYDYDEDLSAFGHKKVARNLVELKKFDYKKGISVSGDKFVSDKKEALDINKEYNALCYDMELSAISLISNMNKIPIISLKYISDKADSNADMDFNESLKTAANTFSKFLLEIIKTI
ncbi:MAG: 5'-methylthioadenosine/S-adenosylhomocysteine nucleosidase [Bacillota bacterium]